MNVEVEYEPPVIRKIVGVTIHLTEEEALNLQRLTGSLSHNNIKSVTGFSEPVSQQIRDLSGDIYNALSAAREGRRKED